MDQFQAFVGPFEFDFLQHQPQGIGPELIVVQDAEVAQRQRLTCCEQRRFQDTLGLRHVHGVGLSEKNASRRG
jgi:hypothetical protein